MMPPRLREALAPVTIIVGHYGVGKTNLACNMAIDLAAEGDTRVSLTDLDIVNPYFRATEQREVLEQAGVSVIAPVFAEAGTSLDVPSLRGSIEPALQAADESHMVLVDVGGDDAGAVALGRFGASIAQSPFAMLGVLNGLRQEVRDPAEAASNLRAIEETCRLRCTALVDNTHLKGETSAVDVEKGFAYAREVASIMGLPLVAATVPATMASEATAFVPSELHYAVQTYVRNPWE